MESSRNSRRTDSDVTAAVRTVVVEHLDAGQHVLVGLSGGVDSVVLLHTLRTTLPAVGARLSAFHVHHGLSENASRWEDFCRALCASWSVDFTCERVSVPRGSSDGLEGAARRARHAALQSQMADWVALGHHLDDRAETMLFNLLRGAGIAGMAAMPPRRGRLLRPLLGVGRAQIEAYARLHGLEWIQDESNADLRFSRNFLRQRVLAPLNARFPAASRNMAAAARRCTEAQTLLDELACGDLGPDCVGFPVPLARLLHLSEPRARNVLRYLLARSGASIPSEDRLREALRQLLHAAPDRHPAVSCGSTTLKRRGGCAILE